MTAIVQPSLLDRWQRSFGGRRRHRVQPRPLGALGYLANGPVIDGLLEIENLVLVVLYDEPQETGGPALRLAGFGGARMPWGVSWGGQHQNRSFKDLLLRPIRRGGGLRLDLCRPKLLKLALRLDRHLKRQLRRPWPLGQHRLRLPRLWAGFPPSLAADIVGDGPELAAEVRRTGRSSRRLFAQTMRTHQGLTLYPLSWVSHHERIAADVFCDLRRFPRYQVFPVSSLPDDLQGFQGAAQFDFFSSRFRAELDRRQSAAAETRIMPAAV
jgi:hypothetical protein